MKFFEAIEVCLIDKAAIIDGRASRSEFWWFFLFLGIIDLGIRIIVNFDLEIPLIRVGMNFIVAIFFSIPFICAITRRLHDINRSGWWQLIGITGIGIIVILYWLSKKGTPGPNRFGEDPLQNNSESPLIEG